MLRKCDFKRFFWAKRYGYGQRQKKGSMSIFRGLLKRKEG
jgi:hypothetical protein